MNTANFKLEAGASEGTRVVYKEDIDPHKTHVTIIAACDKNASIGRDNLIPWYVPEDFQHFKALTSGHPIIMGRKTYESLPVNKTTGKRILPDRQSIVITSDPQYRFRDGVDSEILVMRSLEHALEACKGMHAFIIGGASIYEQALKYADDMVLTVIDLQVMGTDRFFPIVAASEKFKVVESSLVPNISAKDGIEFDFYIWQRKSEAEIADQQAGYKEGYKEGLVEGLEFALEEARDPNSELGAGIQKRIMERTTPEMREAITGDPNVCPTLEQLEEWVNKNAPPKQG